MDISKLKGAIPDSVLAEIPSVMEKFQINTPLRLAHFLGQCAAESGTFKVVKENLNYSADGLLKTFPKYFKDQATANIYAKNPEKIASRVYANRMGNGNEQSQEGSTFRGRGFIQLTGKTNYSAFDAMVPENIMETPSLVGDRYPLLSAAWFFATNGLNAISDTGITDDVIKKVSKRVNGGYNGIEHRLEYTKKFYNLLK